MTLGVITEQAIAVGEAMVVEASAATAPLAVVFEDDGETGYFYAVSVAGGQIAILDAVLIYSVADVDDRDLPSTITVRWDDAAGIAVLLIGNHAHAVFDFENCRGYCRSEFPEPPSESGWCRAGWSDDLLCLAT